MDFTSFDTLFRIFFVCFGFWLIYGLYKVYNYWNAFRKITCLICSKPETLNQMYRCRVRSEHKFHQKCFQNKQYKCTVCEPVTEIEFSNFV